MIKGKTPEEIRKTFNIKNDFTPAEEEQVFLHYSLMIPYSALQKQGSSNCLLVKLAVTEHCLN